MYGTVLILARRNSIITRRKKMIQIRIAVFLFFLLLGFTFCSFQASFFFLSFISSLSFIPRRHGAKFKKKYFRMSRKEEEHDSFDVIINHKALLTRSSYYTIFRVRICNLSFNLCYTRVKVFCKNRCSVECNLNWNAQISNFAPCPPGIKK
jgi:hypothetical protein